LQAPGSHTSYIHNVISLTQHDLNDNDILLFALHHLSLSSPPPPPHLQIPSFLSWASSFSSVCYAVCATTMATTNRTTSENCVANTAANASVSAVGIAATRTAPLRCLLLLQLCRSSFSQRRSSLQ
ncbi:hypothetical protein F443_11212, partial [Phytophthora nicotianae P1569]